MEIGADSDAQMGDRTKREPLVLRTHAALNKL